MKVYPLWMIETYKAMSAAIVVPFNLFNENEIETIIDPLKEEELIDISDSGEFIIPKEASGLPEDFLLQLKEGMNL